MKTLARIVSIASLIFSMEAGAAEKGGKGKDKGSDKNAAKCDFALEANDSMQYVVGGKPLDPNSKAVTIEVPATCGYFTVYFSHTGNLAKTVMGHNFVLTLTKDAQSIDDAARDPKYKLTDYIPNRSIEPFKSKVVASSTKMLGGGGEKKESIVINPKDLKNKEEYTFFCTFPGHFTMMQGKLKLLYVR